MSGGPKVLMDELLCAGRRVKLYRRTVEYGGEIFYRDLVAFGEAVVVVPVREDGKILFVEQWRASFNRWIVELPAGRVEPGEDPLESAKRELEEETGFQAGIWEPLGRFSVAPGYSDEILNFFLARDLKYVGQHPEKGEVLRVVEMKPEEYLQRISGDVGDLKSVAGVLLVIAKRIA